MLHVSKQARAHSHISMGHLVVPVASQRSTFSPSCSACFCRLCLNCLSSFSPTDSCLSYSSSSLLTIYSAWPHDIVAVCLSLSHFSLSLLSLECIDLFTRTSKHKEGRKVKCQTGVMQHRTGEGCKQTLIEKTFAPSIDYSDCH